MRFFGFYLFCFVYAACAHAQSIPQQQLHIQSSDGMVITYDAANVGGLVFGSEDDNARVLAPYQVARIVINTAANMPVESKETYVDCTVSVDAQYDEWDYAGEAQIRGRGNSSWYWYDKKPYRIKLNKKASLLGMPQGKSWVLLANYRDPTHLMNSFVFVLGRMLGLPFTNHVRYAEVILNGEYIGLYQLTEQVQQGKGRVNVDELAGYLISLDADDGPDLSPDATDNFWSVVYSMPVCVKNPDNPDRDMVRTVKMDLAELEDAVFRKDYAEIKELLDVQSMIDYLIIQELVYNVELDAPRSMYMHKDVDGDVWHMGPLWDFDAGYDFDWGSMYTGHNYFASYSELVLGRKPATHDGTIYRVPEFFSDLFFIPEFVSDFKARWSSVKSLSWAAWNETLRYVDYDAMQRNAEAWPIDRNFKKEISRMGVWLEDRTDYLDKIINNY